MPSRPLSPCSVSGCPDLALHRGRCQRHSLAHVADQRRAEPPRPTRQQMGYGPEYVRARRVQLAVYPLCYYCGRPATVAPHQIEIRAGGEHSVGQNLASVCSDCHNRLHPRGWNRRRESRQTVRG